MTKVTFYSGLREIGGTFAAVETDRAVCMFDFGFAMADRMDGAVLMRPGLAAADLVRLGVLPAADGLYDERNARVLGLLPYGATEKPTFLFISHMHIDHCGGLGVLHPDMPVYMSEESLTLYRRLTAAGDVFVGGHDRSVGVPFGQSFAVEDITVDVLPIDHDCIGSAGALIHTPGGTVCYTGDYRFHGFHPERTRAFGEACRGADMVITEGVSVSFEDVDMLALSEPEKPLRTEYTLLSELSELSRTEPGLLVVNFYERNVERVYRQIENLAQAGRTLVLDALQADYVEAFCPEAEIAVYAPTVHGRALNPAWRVVSRGELLARPEKYALQLFYRDFCELFDLKDAVSRYVHADGSPLGDYDPSYGRMLAALKVLGIPYDYRGLGGHSQPYYLRWMMDTIGAGVMVPLHSFRPEQVRSEKAGRQVLPKPGQSIVLGE